MFKIRGEIIIDRPVEEVFDFAVDERNEPIYNPHMRSAEISEGPIGVGTRFRSEVSSMGRPIEVVGEITAYERPRRYGLAVHMSIMEIRGDVTFAPVPVGTRMRWSWEVEPRGAYKWLAPIMAPVGRRQERAIWEGLKRVLEKRKVPSVHDGPLGGRASPI